MTTKTKLLISGSRKANESMLAYAAHAVDRANEVGWSIIVGDAPGVDAIVIKRADQLKVPIEVWGAHGKLRYRTRTGINGTIQGGYLERDRRMVDKADRVLAVWNGESRGTKYTYDYAVKLGKKAWLVDFKE